MAVINTMKGLQPNFVVKEIVVGGPEPQRLLAVREQDKHAWSFINPQFLVLSLSLSLSHKLSPPPLCSTYMI